jgi:serine/threonine protein kinase
MEELRESVQAALGSAYALGRELGGGGMSRVFLADDSSLERQVVVKVLLPELASAVSVQRFAREVRATATLQHPHIVPVLSAGHTSGDVPFYVMPFVPGETLGERLRRGRVPFVVTVQIMGDVAKALAAVHNAHLVHRDVKPDNIMVCGDAAVVTDFGIAHAIGASRVDAADVRLTTTNTSLGTPAYLAPEQAAGDAVDARTDVYSWGVVAYEMIAGQHPFPTANTAQKLMAAHIAERPAPLAHLASDTPIWFSALVMRCLEKDPERRPENGAALVHAVEYGPTEQRSLAARWAAGARWLWGGFA